MSWSEAVPPSSPWASRLRRSICAASSEFFQVGRREKVRQGGLDALGRIDLALLETPAEVRGRQVDVHDLVGLGENGIGQPLADLDADRVLDDVVEAFEVLDVERADDVDSGGQDILNVLVSFRVPAARDIRVGELVDEGHLRLALDHRFRIHFLHRDAVVFLGRAGNDFQALGQAGDIGPAVGFEKSDDDVDALVPEAVALLEHLIGLADAGRVAEVDLEPAPLGPADHPEKDVGSIFRHRKLRPERG
jgi:hypothetical protein